MEREVKREKHGKPAIEIEGQDGSRIELKEGSDVVFGRGKGYHPKDLTVSRRHISFELNGQTSPSFRVSFEVLGKNPVWVLGAEDEEIRVFRRFERGELSGGDSFCVSSNDPIWFELKRVGVGENESWEKIGEREWELSESLERVSSGLSANDGFESVDVSGIDPVKEFGFLVIGHEFDNYPRQMICNVKSWDWFLQEPGEESTDDSKGSDQKGKRNSRGKRKKSRGADNNDDEDWTGESRDEEEVVTQASKARRPKYQTRSKECGGPRVDVGNRKWSVQKRSKLEREVEEDEEDETLGGFIADSDGDEEEVDEEEEEEEQFEDDDEE